MIPDLEHKANNEKYFKSIRYFSHSLKGEKRRNFIAQVAEHNIYLAAQCIMSAEKDEELENRLIEKSQSIAQNFADPENSAKGFLALAEFENLEIISSLFSSIKKPSSIHLQVITKILENKPSDVFCSFLMIFMKTDKPILVQFAINGYNNEVVLTNTNIGIMRAILNYFIENRLFGLLGIFLTKFNLVPDFSYIVNKKIDEIIRQISNSKFTGTKLAYKLAVENNLINDFTPEYFIKKAASREGRKPMLFALSIANKYGIKKINELDKLIEASITTNKKDDIKRLKSIGKKVIIEYISNSNIDLLDKVNYFFEKNTRKRINDKNDFEKTENIDSYIEKKHSEPVSSISNSVFTIQKYEIIDVTIEGNIERLLNTNRKNILIDNELASLQEKWNTSLMEISHLLRIYELKGIIKHLMDYGCYVQPQSFRTAKLLFLHKNQITDKQEVNHPNEVLKEGDIISFRIIGINQQNHRLNISCLDSFKSENSAVPTDK